MSLEKDENGFLNICMTLNCIIWIMCPFESHATDSVPMASWLISVDYEGIKNGMWVDEWIFRDLKIDFMLDMIKDSPS